MSKLEYSHLCRVNAEYRRSKGGKWRRLFPSIRGDDYLQFLDSAHRLHRLPFEL